MGELRARIFSKFRDVLANFALSSDAKVVRAERLTYLSAQKILRLERSLDDVIKEEIPGDVLEFGVALGGSSILLAKTAIRDGRSFHGFDVFATIPPPQSTKDDQKSKNRYETIASGQSEGIGGDIYYGYREDLYSDVCRTFERHAMPVDGRSVALHKGLFEETWPEYCSDTVAFSHIDCDWYDPVKFSLRSVHSRLVVGGIIVLDDYHDYSGCKTATDEFLSHHPGYQKEDGPNVILRRLR